LALGKLALSLARRRQKSTGNSRFIASLATTRIDPLLEEIKPIIWPIRVPACPKAGFF